MSVDFKTVKLKIEENLPEMLPKAVKWVLVHILMLLCHFRMPLWVTALKVSKTMKNIKIGKRGGEKETSAVSENISLWHKKFRARRKSLCHRREKMRLNLR